MSFSPDPSRLLVTGGSGQLGSALREHFPEAMYPSREQLDLARPRGLRTTIIDLRPSAVINCAAYTAVDRAEDDEATATTVNGESVGILASVCSELGVPFVTYSTDYVFDGTKASGYSESDEPAPLNAYGRSKVMGERLALANHEGALVVRTSWVISGTHDNFVSAILGRALAGGKLDVVDDQRGRPTIASDLAVATTAALSAGLRGIVHLANPPTTTWYGLARAVVDAAGLATAVDPCTSDAFPTIARRPQNSTLVTERVDFGFAMPPWAEALPGLVESQRGRLR